MIGQTVDGYRKSQYLQEPFFARIEEGMALNSLRDQTPCKKHGRVCKHVSTNNRNTTTRLYACHYCYEYGCVKFQESPFLGHYKVWDKRYRLCDECFEYLQQKGFPIS
jgi:hypothetical protein